MINVLNEIEFECSVNNKYCRGCGRKMSNEHAGDICPKCIRERKNNNIENRRRDQEVWENIIPKIYKESGIY